MLYSSSVCMRIPGIWRWKGFICMHVCRKMGMHMCLRVCVCRWTAGSSCLANTQYYIKSPDTNIHKDRNGLWLGRWGGVRSEVGWDIFSLQLWPGSLSEKSSSRNTPDLYTEIITKDMCTKELMFVCISACFVHGFKLLWVNGFTRGLCSMSSFLWGF